MNELHEPGRMIDKLLNLNCLLNSFLKLWVVGLVQFEIGKEITDEGEEYWLILADHLGKVHVPEGSHHNNHLRVILVNPLGRS